MEERFHFIARLRRNDLDLRREEGREPPLFFIFILSFPSLKMMSSKSYTNLSSGISLISISNRALFFSLLVLSFSSLSLSFSSLKRSFSLSPLVLLLLLSLLLFRLHLLLLFDLLLLRLRVAKVIRCFSKKVEGSPA